MAVNKGLPLGAIKAERPQCLVQRLDWLRDQVDNSLAALIYLCRVLVHQQVGVAELMVCCGVATRMRI